MRLGFIAIDALLFIAVALRLVAYRRALNRFRPQSPLPKATRVRDSFTVIRVT
jgi:hypothetical protein